MIIGQSISGGAATIAAATAPELITGIVELAPFTRHQPFDLGGLVQVRRYRTGYTRLALTLVLGRLSSRLKYLDVAYPTKPADWAQESARISAKLSEPGRMRALQAMCKTKPDDAAAQLPHVRCPVLVVEGSADPDRADPRAEGESIVANLPEGLGEPAVIDGD